MKRIEIGQIIRRLCAFKEVTIMEEVCSNHVHILIEETNL